MNRRERKIYEKEQVKKVKRKIDWRKVYKSFRTLLSVGFVFALLIFCFSYYVTDKHNKIRKEVSENSKTTFAKIIYITPRKMLSAKYEYLVNGRRYENSTFHSFKGNIGDEIRVEYSSINPTLSIYCDEKEIESIQENVVVFSVKFFGAIVLGAIVLILFELVIGNKRLMLELTSRNN